MFQNKTKIFQSIIGLWLLTSILLCCGSKTQEAKTVASDDEELVKVKFHNLTIDPQSKQPVVLLADFDEQRALLIWIGIFEARAIHSEMQGIEPLRPLTHDLLKRTLDMLEVEVERVEITRLEASTFFAIICLAGGGRSLEIDARPSDSMALAVRAGAPIFVAEDVWESAAIQPQETVDEEEEVERFREFLENIDPADFQEQ